MKKSLRICLAMGGGVSLGVFSGSSLTEALKLLLLFGQDKKGNPYDNIVVDGMSGASAGAIALTIMLKSLMDYKSMMKIYNENNPENTINEASLLKEVANDYFNRKVEKIPKEKREQVIALQVAQKIQYQIWVEQLNSKSLFGEKLDSNHNINIHGSFGLLDRGLMERLAKQYLLGGDFDFKNAQILDNKRVIFACSITNLLPIEITNGNGKKLTKLEENFLKSTGSTNHSELRVIDFIFDKNSIDPNKHSDSRWLKFYADAIDETMDLDINKPKAWSVLVASALACGAFPVAFEPVLLKRYKKEYGNENWPKQFKAIEEEIKNETGNDPIKKSYFNENDNAFIDYKSFNFPYMDGGTFNNEPIREAFRIASFQDFGKNNKDFDRLVLFVDPAVRSESHRSFNVESFSPITQKNNKVSPNGEHNKLINNVTGIVGILQRQGSIKEEHRIKDIKENLELRNNLYEYINNNDLIHKKLTYSLIRTTFQKIHNNLKQGMIPVGTRDIIKYFENELKKNCQEPNEQCKLIDLKTPTLLEMKAIIENVEEQKLLKTPEKVYELLNKGINDPNEEELRKVVFAKTIFKMMADFSLKTVGKNKNAENMSILPIAPDSLNTIELPGDEIAAFAGFASLKSRIYSFNYGKLSTLLSLGEKEDGYRDIEKNEEPIINIPNIEDVKNGFIDTLENSDFYDPKYKFADEIKTNLFKHGVTRISNLLFSIFKFRFNLFELFKGLKNSFITLFVGIIGTLVASLKFYKLFKKVLNKLLNSKAKSASEDISYKKLIPITISILSKDKISKRVKIVSNGKGAEKITMHRLDIKDENNNVKHYQYLFQLYYLEYLKKDLDIDDFSTKSMNKAEPTMVNKIDPEDIGDIGLSFINKIPNPSKDNNINYQAWRKAFETESKKIEIKDIELEDKSIGSIIKDINERKYSLYYSLKNLNYHVSPMLEYNMDKPNDTWYFKENTKAFYLELMDTI